MSRPSSRGVRAAVFLDRDGVLNREANYVYRIEDFEWIPGAKAAVARFNRAGFVVLVVTNQAGVARGYYTEADVRVLHEHMLSSLADEDARIDAFYYSPYHPEGIVEAYRRKTECRKPGTELFERAIDEWHVDPNRSYMVGDKNSDIEPARRLGMTTLLVETGHGSEARADTKADYVVADIASAAEHILRLETSNR